MSHENPNEVWQRSQEDVALLKEFVGIASEYELTSEEVLAIEKELSKGYPSHTEWIHAHGKDFIKLIQEKPHLAEEYETDPEGCIKYIQECLLSSLN